MKNLFYVGIVCVALGLLSLFVSVPHAERLASDDGAIIVQSSQNSQRAISPYVTAVLLAGGLAMMVAGCRMRKSD
jgi:hypothetical protein